ncbi:MAG: hypothetical protein KDA99_22350 [Planctomycetales bacterium]|nr:hypothetical protein [Planctomycetales bacterium]
MSSVLQLDSYRGPKPTDRTMQFLRRYGLVEALDEPADQLIEAALDIAQREPTAENVYAIAELAYLSAQRAEAAGDSVRAGSFYFTALANSYFYLFSPELDRARNPYDPQFRRACDVYNQSLESTLRAVQASGELRAGGTMSFRSEHQNFSVSVASRGTWQEEHFDTLSFVSDYKVEELANQYKTYGLGVPMIAAYKSDGQDPAAQFYPPGMSYPVTAFLRIETSGAAGPVATGDHFSCILELHDPLTASDIDVHGRLVPLQTDLTTPLAYSLDNPMFKKANAPMRGLRDVESSYAVSGLYLLEPYDARKIPVVMVHGFYSSLVTWMEMFNDLRGSPDIRQNYQFWFYLYPTGTPFWINATNLRSELARVRHTLDPGHQIPAMDNMVVVGHSMGGLLGHMQTIDSGDAFWQLVSDRQLDTLQASDAMKQRLREMFYFHANPSIRRLVTIATPHAGSNFSNSATQWLSRKLIAVPERLEQSVGELVRDNPESFAPTSLLRQTTAVDSLAVSSPILPVLMQQPRPPWLTQHNIVAEVDGHRMIGRVARGSDGVVTRQSAALPSAVSETVVTSDHVNVHRKPLVILEVRRILREHLLDSRATREARDERAENIRLPGYETR